MAFGHMLLSVAVALVVVLCLLSCCCYLLCAACVVRWLALLRREPILFFCPSFLPFLILRLYTKQEYVVHLLHLSQ